MITTLPVRLWIERLLRNQKRSGQDPKKEKRKCRFRPLLEGLEERTVPSVFTPYEMQQAYGVNQISFGSSATVGNGAGQTIAIIDSGLDSNIATDLQTFDTNYSVMALNLSTFGSFTGQVVNNKPWFNQVTAPGSNPGQYNAATERDLSIETSLDCEWAHSIAPMANILLVDTDEGASAIASAAKYAATLSGISVVSMSYGFSEPSNTNLDSNFVASGTTFLASAGDDGSPGPGREGTPIFYPSGSPNVVAVGGTTLSTNSDGSYLSETAWSFPTPRLLSNPAFAGTWNSQTGYSTASPGNNTATFSTTITSDDQGGNSSATELSATWVPSSGNATNASFQIYENNNLIDTVPVNQLAAPIGIAANGSVFQELGDYNFSVGDTVKVVLNANGANGTVVAQSIGVAPGGATGGGISGLETKPTYQSSVTLSATNRTVPDVAFDADPNSGVYLIDSFNPQNLNNFNPLIVDEGGTSLSAPCWAGLIAIADQARGALGSLSSAQTLAALYALPSYDFHDITTGYNGYLAGPGYDLDTGLGSPITNQLVLDVAGVSGPMTYLAPEGQGTNNLKLILNGTTIDLYNNGNLVDARPLSSTTEINIIGANDTTNILTVDFSGGDPIPSGGLSFNGSTPDYGNTLILVNGSFTNEIDTATSANAGTITLDGATITYSDLTPIIDTVSATTYTINDPKASDVIDINNTLPQNGFQCTLVQSVSSSPVGFEYVIFANKTSVTINDTAGGDTFNVNNSAPAAGLGTLTLSGAGTGSETFNITTAGSGVILNVNGSGSGNSINGPALPETWNITAHDSGDIIGSSATLVTSFNDIQNLTGGGFEDTFLFGPNGDLNDGMINGGGAISTTATIMGPDYPEFWNIYEIDSGSFGNLANNTTNVLLAFSDVGNLTGGSGDNTFTFQVGSGLTGTLDGGSGGDNTINGPEQVDTWYITGSNAGTIPTLLNAFIEVQNLTGGGDQDTFHFGLNGTLAGTINGNGLDATIIGPNATTFWLISGAYMGSIGKTNTNMTNVLNEFESVQHLIGGSGNDTFMFGPNGTMINGTINGGGGNNTIDGPTIVGAPINWAILGANTGYLTTVNLAFSLEFGVFAPPTLLESYMQIQNLVGGSYQDVFWFFGGSESTITGGIGVTTIYGPTQTNYWYISGPNAGSLPGVVASFMSPTSASLNLNAGGVQDTFQFLAGGTLLNGYINGAYPLPFSDLVTAYTIADTNTILGPPDKTVFWSINGAYSGSIGTLAGDTINILKSFSYIGNLVGGAMNDTFTFSYGGMMGTINGGVHVTTIVGPPQLNYWQITGVNSGTILGVLDAFMTTPVNSGGGFSLYPSYYYLTTYTTATLNLTGGGIADLFTFGDNGSLNGTIDGTGGSANGYAIIAGPNENEWWFITGPNSGSIGNALTTPTDRLLAFKNVVYLEGGNENDTFTFGPNGSLAGSLDGGFGNNTVSGPDLNEQWRISAPNIGTLGDIGATGIRTVFVNIENLLGGAGQDVFIFLNGGDVAGNIDGGGGLNWLNYDLNVSVYVNLTTGGASSVVGVVTNVQNVIGSTVGGDFLVGGATGGVLVGHGSGNTVVGGGGADVLIGGYGKNFMVAGTGEDIMIGGATIYDYNTDALTAILAEWQSGLSYATRIQQLKYGGGLNGAYVLDLNVTVFVSSTPPGPRFGLGGGEGQTTIIGNSALDWFFTYYSTTIIYLQQDEQVD